MPILLQSTDINHKQNAAQINIPFLHKKSSRLLQDLKKFIMRNFGFGDFELLGKDDEILYKCTNIYELREAVKKAPIKSLKYHASKTIFQTGLLQEVNSFVLQQ